jgi:hypothetical protein
MATSETGKDAYSGRPRFELRMNVTRSDTSGNQSRYTWWLRAYNLDGTNYTWDGTAAPWTANVEGSNYSGNKALDFRGGQDYITISSGETGWKTHNSQGELTVNYSASHSKSGWIFGSASLSGSFASTPLLSVPGQPDPVKVVDATPTSLNYTGSSTTTGGAELERSQHQITLEGTGWDNPIQTKTYPYPSGIPSFFFQGLQSSKKYGIRYRYENSVGWGPWSSTVYGTTLAGGGPTLTVVPSANGTSATVTLKPPGGVSGVDYYMLSWKAKNTTSVTTVKVTGSTYVVNGLTPGTTYEWTATATYNGYTSIPSDPPVVKPQPNPNTSAGDYFDGDTPSPPNTDLDFVWDTGLGPAKNTQSYAVLPAPTGWLTFAQGNTTSGGTGVVAQVSDAAPLPGHNGKNLKAGTHAARVQFNSDTIAAGFVSGLSNQSSVLELVTYVASMYVFVPGRQQRLAMRVAWYDAGGGFLGATVAEGQVVPASTWVRLSLAADSPKDAVTAAVRLVDVVGDGWSVWHGGDTITMDAAMLAVGTVTPYFDGSFVDDGTYAYDWASTAHASSSVRTSHIVAPPDPLADPDCDPIPAPPRPPVILDECIDDPPSWRRYWYTIDAREVSDWLAELPTIILTSGQGVLDENGNPTGAKQIRIRIYANPFEYAPEQIDTESYCSEQIISYMPPFSTFTLDGPLRRVFAEVQGQQSRSADHLLYGTGGTPATWPELTCGIQHLMSIDEPLPSPPNNVVARLMLTRRT